ncbi:MAG TPA: hypothetical protein VLB44_00705 [Kofleriaceae bacterium]|nr:hypothetical protein [Kofleriaceae bacterium]
MFVRLIAVLLALGMLAISVQAPDLISTAESALVDDANDVPPVDLVEVAMIPVERVVVRAAPPRIPQPVRHQPELSIFRPPRAFAIA